MTDKWEKGWEPKWSPRGHHCLKYYMYWHQCSESIYIGINAHVTGVTHKASKGSRVSFGANKLDPVNSSPYLDACEWVRVCVRALVGALVSACACAYVRALNGLGCNPASDSWSWLWFLSSSGSNWRQLWEETLLSCQPPFLINIKFRPKTPFSPKKVSKSQPTWKVCIKIDGHASHVQLYSLGWQFSASQSQFFTSSPQCARPPHNGSWLHADVQLNRFHFDQPLKTFQRDLCKRRNAENVTLCLEMGLYSWMPKREKLEWRHFESVEHTSRIPSVWSLKTTQRGKAIVRGGQWSFALYALL